MIPNFTNDEEIRPTPPKSGPLRREWGFTGTDFVVGYSGNLGRAHDINTLIDAAAQLRDDNHIKFLFVGGGHLRRSVEERVAALSLPNVIFKPYQPRENLSASLGVPDVHWLSLKPQLEGLIVPSKAYGAAAAGRPLIAIGDPEGEIASIVREHSFGAALPIGASDKLARLLRDWASDPEHMALLGAAARQYLDAHASKDQALAAWRRAAEELTT